MEAGKNLLSNKRIVTAVISTFLFLGCVSSVHAATYYVSNSGSDSNPGTLSAPWRTLVYSSGKLAAGDTLFIRGGTYQEKVTFSNSGTASQPINISAYNGENPVIDGNYQLPSPTSRYSTLVKFAGSYINVNGLEVKNSFWQGIVIGGANVILSHITSHDNLEQGILAYGSTDAIIEDSIVYNNAKSFENGIYNYPDRTSYANGLVTGPGSYRTIMRRNKVYHNWGEGMNTYNAHNTVMEDNIVYDNSKEMYISDTDGALVQRNLIYCTPGNIYRLDHTVTQHGINMQDENQQPPSANITIINNFVVGCVTNFKWYPFTSNSSMNNVLVANNTFVNATGTTSDANFKISAPNGISHINTRIVNNVIEQDDDVPIGSLAEPSAGITFSNNTWSKNPPAAMLGTNSLVADPLLLKTGSISPDNLTADYFKLTASSPAIDHGIALTEVTSDFFNIARPQGSAYDMGGYEYVVSNSVTPTQAPLIGDVNGDGRVDAADFIQVALRYAATSGKEDLNLDGLVNAFDLSTVIANFSL